MRRVHSFVANTVMVRGIVAAFAVSLMMCSGCGILCELLGIPSENCGTNDQRSQSLTVDIEVRFLGVEDEFFERIGVDFNFNFDEQASLTQRQAEDRLPANQPANAALVPSSEVGGQENTHMFVPDAIDNQTYFLPTVPQSGSGQSINYYPAAFAELQIPFGQEIGLPDFSGFTGSSVLDTNWSNLNAASFGLAILSDIEAFFFLQAARDDTRNGIITAPKVTLFNGQSATVIATNENTLIEDVEMPFFDAASALNPNVSTVTSGPAFDIRPVISADRRFIMMEITPIRAVQLTANQSAVGNGVNNSIFMPVIQLSTVNTTVSVPDGGTILLGGLTLNNGQKQRGVPILNTLPYINRLFRNTGSIKDTQSLLVMVTPRIIIE
ncbi:MAG: type II and III secretion system protein [Phycisphaerales bacterium]|nr:type II and III secretion system protein [Phycisphaerales bacterium]